MSFIFFALFSVMLINSIQCEMCNLEDQECITLAMKRLYPIVVVGNTELEVEPSDPLKKDKIVANLPNLNYTLTNAEMHGYSNCTVREARFNTVDDVWHLFLDCPNLELNMNYDLNGFIASEKLMGKGQSKISFDKYEISMNGGIQKEIREDKIFIQLINFEITRLEVTGNVHFSFNNLFNDDSERTKKMNKFINDHWQEFNSQAQVPGMKAFLSVLVEHFNQYFKKVPIDKIFEKV